MKRNIRCLTSADVLIVEGTLAGCALALHLARAGLRVALVMRSTSPGHEVCACLRPWFSDAQWQALPESLRPAAQASLKPDLPGPERMLHVGRFARSLEDLLLDAGVRLFYDAHPAGLLVAGSHAAGALLGGKFGLAAVRASFVVDTTPDARLARMGGYRFSARNLAARNSNGLELRYVLDCRGPAPADPIPLTGPGFSGEVYFHENHFRGGRPEAEFGEIDVPTHFAEFHLQLPPLPQDALTMTRVQLALRRTLVAVGTSLVTQGRPLHALRGGDAFLACPTHRLESASGDQSLAPLLPQGVEGLLVVSPACDLPDDQARTLAFDPAALARFATDRAATVERAARQAAATASADPLRARWPTPVAESICAGEDVHFDDPAFDEPGVTSVQVDLPPLPLLASADLLVTGGGTSGFAAAWQAASDGLDVICLDKQADFGGTHTLGGVPDYWYGRRTAYWQTYEQLLQAYQTNSGLSCELAMFQMALQAGVRWMPNTPVCGVLARERYIEGGLVLTPYGPAIIMARQFIDASGDGDLAAWAGAAYTYGTQRDESTLWYSFAHFHKVQGGELTPGASRTYASVVDQRSLADTTRAIIAGRRHRGMFGEAEYPQYYLAPRESRHITGRATVTYGDILSGRGWPDLVLVAHANFDIKGLASSDLAMCGFVEWDFVGNYDAPLPYRALLPPSLDNLLVIGKAYSITHDAVSLARMQTDLIAMGGMAALAAGQCLSSGRNLANADLPDLQESLVACGMLTRGDLATRREPQPRDLDPSAIIERIIAGEATLAEQVGLLAQGPIVTPLLHGALSRASGAATGPARLTLSRLLAYLGDAAGAETLLAALGEALSSEPLPDLAERSMHIRPDHGWAPQPCFWIACLARLGDRRLLSRLERLVEQLDPDPRQANAAFSYVHALTWALERLALPDAIPLLQRLAAHPALADHTLSPDQDIRLGADEVRERWAYLELCAGRALARCGSPAGYRILMRYLADVRLFLARSARRELADLGGQDHGWDAPAWEAWLTNTQIEPLPLRGIWD